MTSQYQPGIPTGTVQLNVDYQNIQKNFQQLDTTFGIDHTTFSNKTSDNGYHTVIHLIPYSTTASDPPDNQPVTIPLATSAAGQLLTAEITDGFSTDQALYYQSAKGLLTQLTRNFQPSAATNGYTMLPGGLVLQWGAVITGATNVYTPVTFATNNKAFPNNCFFVIGQPLTTNSIPSSTAVVGIKSASVSKTSFEWILKTSSAQYMGFFWVALGN